MYLPVFQKFCPGPTAKNMSFNLPPEMLKIKIHALFGFKYVWNIMLGESNYDSQK